jgi:hypothetical protein
MSVPKRKTAIPRAKAENIAPDHERLQCRYAVADRHKIYGELAITPAGFGPERALIRPVPEAARH